METLTILRVASRLATAQRERFDPCEALEQEQKRILDTEKKLLDKLSKSQKVPWPS